MLGPVHVHENGAVLSRMRLLSTITVNGAIATRSPGWSDLKTMLFKNAVFQCGRRKRRYLKTVTSSKSARPGARPIDREYPKWRTDATMQLQFRANFAGRYIEMCMRRVHSNVRTEGIKSFQNGYGVVVWMCENDSTTISVDANLFENGAKQLRFRLKTDQCGRGLCYHSYDYRPN